MQLSSQNANLCPVLANFSATCNSENFFLEFEARRKEHRSIEVFVNKGKGKERKGNKNYRGLTSPKIRKDSKNTGARERYNDFRFTYCRWAIMVIIAIFYMKAILKTQNFKRKDRPRNSKQIKLESFETRFQWGVKKELFRRRKKEGKIKKLKSWPEFQKLSLSRYIWSYSLTTKLIKKFVLISCLLDNDTAKKSHSKTKGHTRKQEDSKELIRVTCFILGRNIFIRMMMRNRTVQMKNNASHLPPLFLN